MTLTLSAQFATSMQSPQHIAVAEELGYTRAWLFDTPHQSPDVWMTLALAAARTTRIGLGPGVLVPTLRHPMVNASAAAALAALAPGRVAVAFGTGFAGARALGMAPTTWVYLRDYVRTFRTLLAGKPTTWNGSTLQMMHPPELQGLNIPVLISALGPKGIAVAAELADGLFSVNGETSSAQDFAWSTLGIHGTVVTAGEASDSPRVRAAAGPGNALAYHAAYEFGGDVTALPGGQAWLDHIEAVPHERRHLAVHDQHLTGLNAADQAAWAAGAWQAIPATTVTGSAADITERLSDYAAQGISEIIYQPTGPDIPGELETFVTAARPVLSAAQAEP
ncbi:MULTISPECIES: LLM class flavin-dependent oxidoreductase [unclassified Mycolicibacterium]|uniref:LLM class flavin-dependent oxidoreductase n=1 Tax=unclassified Mycolicibacterium TaxID=2636767 RepID=UPI002EDB40AB